MKLHIILYLVYIVAGITWPLLLLKTKPWRLFFSGIALTMLLISTALMLIHDSKIIHEPIWDFIGQSLLVFFTIIGGMIVSCAWSELRKEYQRKEKVKS